MSLAEKAKTRVVAPKRNPIDAWLETLPEAEREAGISMLTDPTWTQRELVNAFADEGFRVGREKLSEWRKANDVAS